MSVPTGRREHVNQRFRWLDFDKFANSRVQWLAPVLYTNSSGGYLGFRV